MTGFLRNCALKAGVALGVSVFAVAGATAAQAEVTPDHPHIVDECGDANEVLWVDGTTVGTPDEERAAMFDVKAAWFDDILDEVGDHNGVRVTLEMCGDVPEPELAESRWEVSWNIGDSCHWYLGLQDHVDSDSTSLSQREARLESGCGSSGSSFAATLEDDSWSVDGNRITWTLTQETVPADGPQDRSFLTRGTSWLSPEAGARDGRAVMLFSGNGGVDQRANLVGTIDCGKGRDFTVGETEPTDAEG